MNIVQTPDAYLIVNFATRKTAVRIYDVIYTAHQTTKEKSQEEEIQARIQAPGPNTGVILTSSTESNVQTAGWSQTEPWFRASSGTEALCRHRPCLSDSWWKYSENISHLLYIRLRPSILAFPWKYSPHQECLPTDSSPFRLIQTCYSITCADMIWLFSWFLWNLKSNGRERTKNLVSGALFKLPSIFENPDLNKSRDFPGGAVVKNPPANAGDMGSSPGPGRSHMPRSNYARAPQLLSLRSRAREPQLLSPCATTTEAHAPRARAPQQKKPLQWEARVPQQRVAPARHN